MSVARASRFRWARILAVAVAVGLAGFLLLRWREASIHGGQRYAEPFRIAGNLYYVGANDVASFLLTGPDGHVLIDGGYPGTADLILSSIDELGFDIRDVRVLLNTHYHYDHAGGLAALQAASGADLWVSLPEADVVASGGDDPALGVLRLLVWSGAARYPRPRVDHRFGDGDTIRLGPLELAAHVTPGHSPGCTTWTFPVREAGRDLLAGLVCAVGLSPRDQWFGIGDPDRRADWERTFQTWRRLPVELFLAPHARAFGRWRKFEAGRETGDPADPFIDPGGYRAFIEETERQFRAAVDRGR